MTSPPPPPPPPPPKELNLLKQANDILNELNDDDEEVDTKGLLNKYIDLVKAYKDGGKAWPTHMETVEKFHAHNCNGEYCKELKKYISEHSTLSRNRRPIKPTNEVYNIPNMFAPKGGSNKSRKSKNSKSKKSRKTKSRRH
jgi:hypothetical protein